MAVQHIENVPDRYNELLAAEILDQAPRKTILHAIGHLNGIAVFQEDRNSEERALQVLWAAYCRLVTEKNC
jgi:hypothetical protein